MIRQKLKRACKSNVLEPNADCACPKLGLLVSLPPLVMLFETLVKLTLFSRLKTSTRNSIFAFSPRTGTLGMPKLLVRLPSRSR